MRRKIGIWMIMGLLLLRPAMPVHAAPSDNSVAEAVSGYCLGDELHAFIRLKEGYDVSKFKVSLQSDSTSAGREGAVVQITETDAIIRYVFMVDLSGSMKNYAKKVNTFVDSLMESEKRKAFYTVATFGEQFQVVKENLTDRSTVAKALGELRYKEKLTDPYTGVDSALTYLDGYSIKSGDLIHLVVITDGDPELGIADEAECREREKELAQSLTERITETPEIIVSTLCMEQWDEYAYQALSTGRGIHEIIDDDLAAEDAGVRMAEYVDSLYRVSFRLSEEPEEERFSLELTFKERGAEGIILSLESVPNLKLFSNAAPEGQEENGIPGLGGALRDPDKDQGNSEGTDVDKGEQGQKEIPEDKEDQKGTEVPEDKEDRGETDASGDKEEQTDTMNPEDNEDVAGGETNDGNRTGEDEKNNGKTCLILLLPMAAGVLILAGVCVMLLARKRRPVREEMRPNPEPVQTKVTGTGIAMKLVVYSGKYSGQSTMFYLAEQIMIGSAPECDVVFSDPEVSPRNSRIFMKDQMIYIEDLNSAEGTALGGMRIQGQNRLRSGDVISIGEVEFSFKF